MKIFFINVQFVSCLKQNIFNVIIIIYANLGACSKRRVFCKTQSVNAKKYIYISKKEQMSNFENFV